MIIDIFIVNVCYFNINIIVCLVICIELNYILIFGVYFLFDMYLILLCLFFDLMFEVE